MAHAISPFSAYREEHHMLFITNKKGEYVSMNNQKLSLAVSFRLPIHEAYELDRWCKSHNLNKSALFRWFCHQYLKEEQTQEQSEPFTQAA
jgi:hypothetical protein